VVTGMAQLDISNVFFWSCCVSLSDVKKLPEKKVGPKIDFEKIHISGIQYV